MEVSKVPSRIPRLQRSVWFQVRVRRKVRPNDAMNEEGLESSSHLNREEMRRVASELQHLRQQIAEKDHTLARFQLEMDERETRVPFFFTTLFIFVQKKNSASWK